MSQPRHKKYYPDQKVLVRKATATADALIQLAQLGIAVISVNLSCYPLITVYHCAGNSKLKGEQMGIGCDDGGEQYCIKAATLCGCQVTWTEPA
jgi:hypothetical protein